MRVVLALIFYLIMLFGCNVSKYHSYDSFIKKKNPDFESSFEITLLELKEIAPNNKGFYYMGSDVKYHYIWHYYEKPIRKVGIIRYKIKKKEFKPKVENLYLINNPKRYFKIEL